MALVMNSRKNSTPKYFALLAGPLANNGSYISKTNGTRVINNFATSASTDYFDVTIASGNYAITAKIVPLYVFNATTFVLEHTVNVGDTYTFSEISTTYRYLCDNVNMFDNIAL